MPGSPCPPRGSPFLRSRPTVPVEGVPPCCQGRSGRRGDVRAMVDPRPGGPETDTPVTERPRSGPVSDGEGGELEDPEDHALRGDPVRLEPEPLPPRGDERPVVLDAA